jgi:hypothetical protein
MRTSGRRWVPPAGARGCPDRAGGRIFRCMTGCVRTWQGRRPSAVAGALLAMSALGACGRSGHVADAALRPRLASTSPSTQLGRGPMGEQLAALDLADDYRMQLLSASDFTDIGQDRCNDGWLRGFPRDTTTAMHDATADLVDKFEKLIQEYAVDAPLDSPEGRELLRTVLYWETGRERPKWDVRNGKPNREAIAAGLTEQFEDAATGKCVTAGRGDTATYVLPPVTGLTLAPYHGVTTQLVFGDRGLSAYRSKFWLSKEPGDTSSLLAYTRVSAAMLWKEYAVVTVHRPMEQRDGSALAAGNGGGTYIFHRVGNSWLLLVIARSWG